MADEIPDTENTTLEEIADKAKAVGSKRSGDAVRNTWFLTNSFLGRKLEKRLLLLVLDEYISHLPSHPGHGMIEIHRRIR